MSRSTPHVIYDRADGEAIGHLTLVRSAKLNATDDRTLRDLEAAVAQAASDGAARAIVVGGEGRAFCVGIDLRALCAEELPADWFRRWDETLARIEALAVPTVAAIQGPCLGGGVQIVLCCDLRVAAEDASFGLSAVKHGIIPGLATYRLPRFIGMGPAREMMLMGETWDAERARACGLVDRVVPRPDLAEAATRLARQLAESPRQALAETKRLAVGSYDLPLEELLCRYLEAQQRCIEDPETRRRLERYRQGRWG